MVPFVFCQTLSLAHQNLELSLTAVRDRFGNSQLLQLLIFNFEKMEFDSKTDTFENFLVTLHTKETKAYSDPDHPAVTPIDAHAVDAAAEKICFDQDTTPLSKTFRSAHEAILVQIRCQLFKRHARMAECKLA